MSSDLAKAQGMVSSMYLLVREMNVHTARMALLSSIASMYSSNSFAVATAIEDKSLSKSSRSPTLVKRPSWYLLTIATVRLRRLPKSLAKSVFTFCTKPGSVKLPSLPN